MGGNALKNTVTHRLDAKDYYELEDEVVGKLRYHLNGRRLSAVLAYREKPSFGDMDIVVETFSGESLDWKGLVDSVFKPNEIVVNSEVMSFDYKGFQIDLIRVPTTNYESSLNYMNWNDLSNLFGVVSRAAFGLVYSHRGLLLMLKDDTHQFAEITVSKDLWRVLPFLGYDPERYFQGFESLEDIFEFASSTKFFNKGFYLYENRNHDSRVRDKKRANYRGFLEWLDSKLGLPEYVVPLKPKGYVQSEYSMQRLYDHFPEVRLQVEKALHDFELWKDKKKKFNGSVVSAVTGLQSQELGKFMVHLKKLESKNGRNFVNNLSLNDVKQWILKEFVNYASFE